ncbi:MAG: hypothetical protein A3J48_00985 [Candidatus Doudnabacteria bacterium RIFCSPHIGHO2_02_FULL_46_11]|uniref:Type II secretion system protein GspG C-terminal domain-containing protein n=1 Tax=Candidatus Doudnabacteria bacterium RIFCSPHIGHO2_02_FULL_46_11 TaxID=1817832 RepID=A0A1F5P7H5_9BACT|nr:MAG: hypothetical protein A3J48_00985 [Candidatus Doudnabacteria bacterium RIFCSPHIGHO2_02_FULL_46_11]
MSHNLVKKPAKGFTLLELLIVIAIIAVLSVILVLVLNPAETLKKSRDTQRMSDLSTLKTALGLYLTSKTTPYLGAAASNTACKTGSSYAASDVIFYSYPNDSPGADITDVLLDGSSTSDQPAAGQVAAANLSKADATGWIPVNLSSLTGGAPISNLPVDPTNSVTVGGVTSTDLVYRYACKTDNLTFEINAQLESTAFTSDEDKRTKDGGNNDNYYEVGTELTILGTGTDF